MHNDQIHVHCSGKDCSKNRLEYDTNRMLYYFCKNVIQKRKNDFINCVNRLSVNFKVFL